MHQFNLVTFRCVNECEAAAIRLEGRTIGIFQTKPGEVLLECIETVHFKGQMREVRLHLDGITRGEETDFDQFLAFRGLEKNQFRTAGRFMPAHLLQAEDFAVEFYRAFQIVDAVASVQEFSRSAHERSLVPGRVGIQAANELTVNRRAEQSSPGTLNMIRPTRLLASWLLLAVLPSATAQIDPVKRQLIQIGHMAPLHGKSPLAGYAFYYRNDPEFIRTNLAWRLALAPVYLDTELGIRHVLGERTDLGVGLAGGGFADSYSEIRGGEFLDEESFVGHGGEFSLSLYHQFNPGRRIPLNLVVRGTVHHTFYEPDSDTDLAFKVPEDRTAFSVRTGLRWGGQEPLLFPSLAMELSAWYEGEFRSESEVYGFNDRYVKPASHLFWGQALLAYTLPRSGHYFRVSIIAGTSVQADRFSAYRLGALLPLVSEFPLMLPGYYYQELSAERFVLVGASYIFPLGAKKHWAANLTVATAAVDYLAGLEQPGQRHTGVAGGILYRRAEEALKVMLVYAYGVDAIRRGHRGDHSIGVLLQWDLERTRAALLNPDQPNRWRGWQRIFGH